MNVAICAALRAGNRATAWASGVPAILLFSLSALAGTSGAAQESTSRGIGETPRGDRVVRFQDSLATSDDWDIDVPAIETELLVDSSAEQSFVESVRAGRALNSEAYLAMDRELRQVRRQLQQNPGNETAEQQLAEIRRALIERIEINMRFDYLYAAGVYVELLRQADGAAETVAGLSRKISEKRTLEQ